MWISRRPQGWQGIPECGQRPARRQSPKATSWISRPCTRPVGARRSRTRRLACVRAQRLTRIRTRGRARARARTTCAPPCSTAARPSVRDGGSPAPTIFPSPSPDRRSAPARPPHAPSRQRCPQSGRRAPEHVPPEQQPRVPDPPSQDLSRRLPLTLSHRSLRLSHVSLTCLSRVMCAATVMATHRLSRPEHRCARGNALPACGATARPVAESPATGTRRVRNR